MSDKKFKVGDNVMYTGTMWEWKEFDRNTVYMITHIEPHGAVRFAHTASHISYNPLEFTLVGSPTNTVRILTLPTDSAIRKDYPVLSGCLKYFPAAIAGVSSISKLGNDKHNPGQELHHARGKSTDHGDCIIRHLMDTEDLLAAAARGDAKVKPEAILLEASSLVWRALAYSQELHEKYGAPLAPAAKE